MTSRDFCYWLQGFFELTGENVEAHLNPAQTKMVRDHLALVFQHEIDPSFGTPEERAELQKTHDGTTAKEKLELLAKQVAEIEKRPPQIVERRPSGPERMMC